MEYIALSITEQEVWATLPTSFEQMLDNRVYFQVGYWILASLQRSQMQQANSLTLSMILSSLSK